MSPLKKMRAKSAYSSALAAYESQLKAWEEEQEHVEDLLYMATNLDEVYEASAAAGFSIRLQSGEHILAGLKGISGLVEPRSSGGSYQGGSQGVSFRVAKGVSFRVGQHRGTYQPGPQVQKAIDTGGDLYITTKRAVYTSPGQNREWAYAKAVDVFHSDNFVPDWGVSYVSVSNRQRTSGFAYPMEAARRVRDRLLLGFAIFDGTVEQMVQGLREQEREVRETRPIEPIRPPELGS